MFFKVFAILACARYCQAVMCHDKVSEIIEVVDMSDDDRQLLTDLHNDYRRAISNGTFCNQPKGNDLREIEYDESLEYDALPLLLSCSFMHVVEQDPRFRQGQNIYKKNFEVYTNQVNWATIVKAWADECNVFTYPDKSKGVTGHYTQIAWSKTFTVGCRAVIYKKIAGETYSLFAVCNYGPGGNMKNVAPYTAGEGGCNGLCKNDGTW